MTDRLLIYGATGFTGRLAVREALALGLTPILGGRTLFSLRDLAREQGLSYRLASVEAEGELLAMLRGVDVLLNVAGPFQKTALPLARACIARGVHYLDVSGEFAAIESLSLLDSQARQRGVMLLPAAGFDVVPTDCMAAWLIERLPRAKSLSIALSGLNAISRGSAESVFAQYGDLVMVRRGGRLVRVPPRSLEREFDFGEGLRPATAITWADISTAYVSTGVPDITVYYEATPMVRLGLELNRYGKWLVDTSVGKWWRQAGVRALPDGPSGDERAHGRATVIVEAADQTQRRAVRLHTPEVYSFTAQASVAIVDRVFSGKYTPGFQTPGRVYGAELALSLPGVTFDELSPESV